MFTAAALVSCPPLLIPELAGAAALETAELRRASTDVAGQLANRASRWTIVGVGATEAEFGPDAVGTFAGFGVDIRVALGPDAAGPADPSLPLPLLVGGWLRAAVADTVAADALVVATDTSPIYCAELGSRLRKQLDADSAAHGLLVIADGANTLTAKAPGAFDDRAPEVQRELDRALGSGDLEYLRSLDAVACADLGIEGRAAWQVLAGIFGVPPGSCTTSYQGAPYGVGYHVGMWLP